MPYSESIVFTRTTDPTIITTISRVIKELLPNFELTVKIPFSRYTKSEIMYSVPEMLIGLSHSCSIDSGNPYACS